MTTEKAHPSVLDDAELIRSYPRFIWHALGTATDGSLTFYAWMTFLSALVLVGVNAWAHQVAQGMGVTAMTDHVSWGMYIGNFTYGVGMAAGAIMIFIPAYIYKNKEMDDVVIVGLILAVVSVIGCLAFVNVDIGRIDRFWHIMPVVGRLNWPVSMLTWDVVVLFGYLIINLHVLGYLLYMRYLGRTPNRVWYVPFVILSILWAVSLHTVTAFLYSGLGGRAFWNTAILSPRFMASAFVSGPAFLVLSLQLLQRFTSFKVGDGPVRILLTVLKVTVLINLDLVVSEMFTEFYTGGTHVSSATYLYFGLHGHDALVPWIRTAIAFNVIAALIFLFSDRQRHIMLINIGCALTLVGVWVEKGMGLIVPAFVPSTLHEIVEYVPNMVEWKVSVGIIALVLLLFTLGLKLAAAVFTGEMHARTRMLRARSEG